ncbi:MAG: peptide ABC transporter substrate-binding protein [Thermomicrobium sp.]|nr:peptide ABC transporter substrate-binding protein [Thermomicrobium sp.]MDW8006136.1 peptide ABC transporter substrate-binding protein [Thermomicrobium sp.]
MRKYRKIWHILWLLVLALPVLAACARSQATPTPVPSGVTPQAGETPQAGQTPAAAVTTTGGEKILRIHEYTYPDVFDPQKSSFSNEIAVLHMNYEGLTRLDQNLNTVPAAAESWEFNQDGTVVTFHLRAGLKYSDGTPLTAERFRYAVERTCDPKTAGEYQSILFDIVGCQEFAETDPNDQAAYQAARQKLGVEAPDDRTLIVRLTHPAPYFPTIASLWVFYPARKELIEQGGENWWKDPKLQIGNGPFQMVEVVEDQRIRFVANPNYWEGKPKLDGVEIVYQKESSVALEAYKAGQIDMFSPDPSQLPAIKSDPELSKQLVTYPAATTIQLSFNLTKEPFTDKKVREAFAYAFDRKTFCEQIRNGDCTPTLEWIPPGIPGHIGTDKYGFDPAKAKQALAESSYGGPDKLPEIKLTYNSDDPAARPRMEWIAGQYRDILGVNITLEPVDGKTLVAMRKDPSTYPQMTLAGWIQDYPDPQNWLSVYWKCDATFAQRFGYCNQEFDRIVTQADQELDQQKRIELYKQAHLILIDDAPGPFLYNPLNIWLVKPYVTGYNPTPSDDAFPGEFASLMTLDIQK